MASMATTSAPQRGPYKRPRGQHQGSRRGGPPRRPHGQRPGQVASTSKASNDAAAEADADEDNEEQGPSKAAAEAEQDVPIFERTSLVLASNPLPPLSSLGATLARFTNLHRLDMSDMQPGQADDDDDDDPDEGSSSRRLHSLSFLRDAQREAEKEVRRARKARRKEGKAAAHDDDDDDERKTLAQSLTWLNLSSNPTLGEIQEKRSGTSNEDVLSPLSALTSLRVLNLSSCSLLAPPPRSALLPLSESLCALVLSHNRLTTQALAEALPAMPNLNTLVLSHNRLTGLPRALPGLLPKLAKLSVSHNDLGAGEEEAEEVDSDDESDEEDEPAKGTTASNPLPDFTMNTSLREVRLSHNARLRVLPTHIASWGRGAASAVEEVDEAPAADGSDGAKPRPRKHVRGLELLDVGHCGLSWETVQEALVSSGAAASGIKNLTLAGNADVEDEDDYKGAIRRALPGLVVLDGQRVVERGKKKEPSADQVKESADANATDGDGIVAASGAAAEQERPDKKRKRGSRGGSSGKGGAEEEDVAADVASDDEAEGSSKKGKNKKASKQQSSDSQHEPPKITAPRSGKRAKRGGKDKKQAKDRGEGEGDNEDEDWLAHTRAKAVAAAQSGEEEGDDVDDGPSKRKMAKKEGKVKGKDKDARAAKEAKAAEKKKKKDKKDTAPRKAWDEVVPSAAADGAATEQAATPGDKTAPSASTAVAGVVEVKKKQAQRQQQQQASKPAVLGSGSSWLGGASGDDAGLGDGWGTGQSAWD